MTDVTKMENGEWEMGNGKWEITMEKSGQRSFGSRATTPDFFGDGGM